MVKEQVLFQGLALRFHGYTFLKTLINCRRYSHDSALLLLHLFFFLQE
jgi:hypothetical protein